MFHAGRQNWFVKKFHLLIPHGRMKRLTQYIWHKIPFFVKNQQVEICLQQFDAWKYFESVRNHEMKFLFKSQVILFTCYNINLIVIKIYGKS